MQRTCRRFYSLIFFILFCLSVGAQEMLGIVSSNYSGIHSALINPSGLAGTKFYLDINFFTLGISAENNYVYLAKSEYKFSRFLSANPQIPTHPPDNQSTYDYYNKDLKKAYTNFRIMGPSVLVNYGDHAFGLTTSFRTVVSGRNIPYDLAKFGYSSLNFKPQHRINYKDYKNFDIAAMSWAEIGLSYAYVFKRFNRENWSAGISIKRLMGVGGGYVNVGNIDYMLLNKDTAIVYNLNAEAGYSLPVDYKTNEFITSPLFRGGGFGFDVGITYKKTLKGQQKIQFNEICAQPFTQYKYKIGVSIIDIGRITFKKNAQKLVFNNVSTYWPDISSFNYQNVESTVNKLSEQFYGNSKELLQGNRIIIGLPTALSVQVDIHYTDNWYVNGTVIYPMRMYHASLRRPAQLAVTPRFETDHFELDFPVSLYDFSRPRIGVSLRLGILTIGTDKLGGFFHYSDFTGMDFYFAVKLSFIKGHCKNAGENPSCGESEYKKFTKK
jgi:hypothetical protein